MFEAIGKILFALALILFSGSLLYVGWQDEEKLSRIIRNISSHNPGLPDDWIDSRVYFALSVLMLIIGFFGGLSLLVTSLFELATITGL